MNLLAMLVTPITGNDYEQLSVIVPTPHCSVLEKHGIFIELRASPVLIEDKKQVQVTSGEPVFSSKHSERASDRQKHLLVWHVLSSRGGIMSPLCVR